jgi:hypothetical protein
MVAYHLHVPCTLKTMCHPQHVTHKMVLWYHTRAEGFTYVSFTQDQEQRKCNLYRYRL